MIEYAAEITFMLVLTLAVIASYRKGANDAVRPVTQGNMKYLEDIGLIEVMWDSKGNILGVKAKDQKNGD
tara:strand:+ start:326 stop:535 length:210 start_codon:yes stop_codon:yes gene_type:complete